MTIGEMLREYRETYNISQRQIADSLHIDRSLISKIESGKARWNEEHDAHLARLSWRLAIHLADERTGGFISNILEDIPNLDLHPAAIKEMLLQDLEEAIEELEELRMAKHLSREQRQAQAERVWHEVKDVVDRGAVMLGVLEEEFELDRERLIKRHEMEVKEGKR